MALTEKQRHDLKKFLKELSQYRGRHTEFVSVLVPAGYELVKVIQHLQQEQGTASNIKSTATRQNVEAALERMIQHLRLFKATPKNGLAAYAGNISSAEGKSDVRVWSVEPPMPLNQRLYRCDKDFKTEAIEDMLDSKEVYGLIVIDHRDAMIALLKGKTIIPLQKTHSEVPGKMKAGGQSAMRFSRLRELAAKDHYRKVADYVKDKFFTLEGLKGILVGGPGPTKHEFLEQGHLTNELLKKVIAVKDLGYTEEFGLEELVEKCEDVLANEAIAEEKKVMRLFFETLAKQQGKVTYGEAATMEKVKLGVADKILLSDALDEKLIEQFEEEAKKFSSEVIIISTETREGVQLREMGGVAAILRYETG